MRTNRIVNLYSIYQPRSGLQAREVCAVLTWLMSVGGPIALADKASWELVISECWTEQMDGHTWYRTHPDQLPLDLEPDVQEELARALKYLSDRGVLMAHHDNPNLVRATPELELRLS